jgi:putative tricarboxylic transport membrane protein
MPRSDLPASLVLILFGAVVVYESWRMPRFENIGGAPYSAPGLVPGVLGAVIALFGGIMLLRYLVNRTRPVAVPPVPVADATLEELVPDPEDRAASSDIEVTVGEGLERPSNARMLLTLVLGVVFAVGLVGRMPFWLATFAFVFVFIALFERHAFTDARQAATRLAIAAAIAGMTAFAVPFVFERVFLVNLP